MKTNIITFLIIFAFGGVAFAEENKSTPTQTAAPTQDANKAVQALTGTEKTKRKKKVAMCAECGKPEADCECHGDHKDHKGHDNHTDKKKKDGK